MSLKRWNLAPLIAEMITNTMVLFLWKYLKYLQCKMYFFVEQKHLTEYILEYFLFAGWLFINNPSLALQCLFGPPVPSQWRLHGPGAWPGAAHCVATTWQRVDRPLKTRHVPRPETDHWSKALLIMLANTTGLLAIMWLLVWPIYDMLTYCIFDTQFGSCRGILADPFK